MTPKPLHRQTLAAWAFLAPNILGFLIFVLLPLVASLVMAFTNWDLRHQNIFHHEPLDFVGLENFHRLLTQPSFWSYVRNTFYLMAGIPFSIAGSLFLALLLNRDLHAHRRRAKELLILSAVIAIGAICLLAGDARGTALMLALVWIGVLLAGLAAGTFTYRTLLFIPAFTNGVAVYLLWKKLYNPTNGPINAALTSVLNLLQSAVLTLPPATINIGAVALLLLAAIAVGGWTLQKITRATRNGDLRRLHAILAIAILLTPLCVDPQWLPAAAANTHIAAMLLLTAIAVVAILKSTPLPPTESATGYLLISLLAALLELILIALAATARHLPTMAHQGLAPPDWLASYQWAKPALIFVGFWASVGSGNMLLYLAALSNVSQDLYEAADIDGASPLARFWNVTFPQVGPTTFFIVVMSVIGGIQGGFEIARAMTNGGPAESTTTISFFIYETAFEDGRLGYASAAAWLLCLFVFAVTILNWKVGSRYVND